MSAEQPKKRDNGTAPFAVFAHQTPPNAGKSPISGRAGAAGRNPQSLKAAESLVSQGQAALGSGNAVLAQLRAKQALLASAATTGKHLAFLIMDIDHFKAVNDSYGHDVGDEVLCEFASRVAADVRAIDLACRYGGEEFVVVMPETDTSVACSVAERLRLNVETMPFQISCAPGKLNITISVGIAGSEGSFDTAEALLRRADQALYRAKRDGRNRVVADAA